MILKPSSPVANPRRRHSRRAFLQSLGAAGALAPFFPLLNASGAEARPLRLILWFTPHGTIHDNWKPTGGLTDFQLSPILKPLERHRAKINILDGLRIQADGVGAPHTKGPSLLYTASPLLEDQTFTRTDDSGPSYFGWNSGPSIDQTIASALKTPTPYQSLQFGVRSGSNHPGSRIIYAGAKAPLAPEIDPWKAFNRLLGDMSLTAGERDKTRLQKKSVLDLVNAELGEIATRAPAADRLKIEAHLTAMRSIEQRLNSDAARCAPLDLGESIDANAAINTPATFDRMLEVMASSLACDLTRVMSMQYRVGENDGGYTYDWLGISDQEHHLLSHELPTNLEAKAKLTKIYTWYSERFAYFLDLLAQTPDGDGSLLDNSLVVWGSELGVGRSHSFDNVPFIVAGGAGGQLTTGRYLQYDNVEHNRLLVSVSNLMGAPIDKFGTTDTGQGNLVGLL